MRDKVRDDWATLASLADVQEQDRPPSRRVKVKAAERLWVEIDRLRAVEQAAHAAAHSWDNGEFSTGPRGTELMRALHRAVYPEDERASR